PQGVVIAPLTDRPQAAPPLPADLSQFDGPPGSIPDGWRFDSGVWACDGSGLRQEFVRGVNALAWREGGALEGDWDVGAYLRFPEEHRTEAGITIGPIPEVLSVVIEADPNRTVVVDGDACRAIVRRLPSLGGEPFDPAAFHTLAIRVRSGRAEVRVDGVVL